MTRFSLAARLALLLSFAGVPMLAAQGASHYHVIKRVVIGKASADYIVIDGAGRRLYGLGDNVFDVDKDTVMEDIKSWLGARLPAPRME